MEEPFLSGIDVGARTRPRPGIAGALNGRPFRDISGRLANPCAGQTPVGRAGEGLMGRVPRGFRFRDA
ncbi:hypothetical protein MFU01_26080 [Myxococcus fulvus]|uniref:Uncharacterized protein n=1 Tax=Myxococcus fulvus TaxID=33 RepID=A0A511T064_MYXFU|nr:hypothetical protein MFU01_26080 [Myxococcus fulvus]